MLSNLSDMIQALPLSFFLARIGKLIYFSALSCYCEDCRQLYDNGYMINNPEGAADVHRFYLNLLLIHPSLQIFDNKEDRDNYVDTVTLLN